MNKIEIAKSIIENNGSCLGLTCQYCQVETSLCCNGITDFERLITAKKFVEESSNQVVDAEMPYNPLENQVGGSHYKNFEIQPVTFTLRNKLNFLQGCIVKRICRYNLDGGKGIQDLEKIKHECDILIAELCEKEVKAEREDLTGKGSRGVENYIDGINV